MLGLSLRYFVRSPSSLERLKNDTFRICDRCSENTARIRALLRPRLSPLTSSGSRRLAGGTAASHQEPPMLSRGETTRCEERQSRLVLHANHCAHDGAGWSTSGSDAALKCNGRKLGELLANKFFELCFDGKRGQQKEDTHPDVVGSGVHDCGAKMGKQVDREQNSSYLVVFDPCVLASQPLLYALNGIVRCGTQMLLRVVVPDPLRPRHRRANKGHLVRRPAQTVQGEANSRTECGH